MLATRRGRVCAALEHGVVATLPDARIGETVVIRASNGLPVPASVTRVEDGRVSLSTHAPPAGIGVGDDVVTDVHAGSLALGMKVLGRSIAASGEPLDGRGAIAGRRVDVLEPPIDAHARAPVERPFWTGIKAVDGLCTIGRGARIGIFGVPATGKSMLVEMLARGANADAVVIGLIGERGREAAAWMQRIASHATIVCAPSDRPAAERVRAAHVALAQGSELRRRGLNVLVIIDSIARFVAAARELASRNGESVGRGGYPPSVFAELTRLVERGGNLHGGSLTLVATVLSDGPDDREPLSEAARSVLDGHIMLCHKRARAGLFPTIDPLASASRTMDAVVDPRHMRATRVIRRALARLEETRELRELGFAQPDAALARAIAMQEHLEAFVHHGTRTFGSAEILAEVYAIAGRLEVSHE